MNNDTHNDSHQDTSQRPMGDYRRIELITGEARRRRWSAEERAWHLGGELRARREHFGGRSPAWRQRRSAALLAQASQDTELSKPRRRNAPLFIPVSVAKASETAAAEPAIGIISPGSLSPDRMIEIETTRRSRARSGWRRLQDAVDRAGVATA